MTRTQAWRKVAEAFGTPPEKRNKRQRLLADEGMCWALIHVEGCAEESPANDAKRAEIVEAVEDLRIRLDPFGMLVADEWWPSYRTPEGDDFRATFAGLMAAMTQRERNQLVEGL